MSENDTTAIERADESLLYVDEQENGDIVSGATVNQQFADDREDDASLVFADWFAERYRAADDESDLEPLFDEMIDGGCDEITIGSLSWKASEVLSTMDPIAYRQDFLAWYSDEVDAR